VEKTPLGPSRLEALIESARLLHGARDLDELLGHLLRSVMGRLLMRRGLIALEREETMRLVLLRGLPRLAVGDVFDAAAAEESGIELVLPIGARSAKSRPLGLLGLGRSGRPGREAVGEEEKDFLRAQLGLAASGIENARVHEESQRLNRRLDQKVQDLSSLLDLVRGLTSTLEASDVAQLLMLTLAGRWMLRRSALVAWKPGHPPALRQQGMDIGGLLGDEDARSGLEGLPDAIAVAELPEGALKERLAAAQGELVLPIKSGEGGVGGLIVLGPRPGQRPYEAADLEFGAGLVAQASVALANAWHFRETLEKKKMERELELAASIQANLFPSELPPLVTEGGYDVAVRNRPARQCGGDYYDALPARGAGGEPRVLLCVADVSGKGLPAALLMSNMQATLRALLGRLPSLCELAAQASELLFATTAANKYVTAALLELTPSSGAARYVSAGHTDCLLLRASGEEVWLKSTGAPLGLLVGVPYTDTTFALGAGDCLALFSDGVTEAQSEAGEDFGEARLCDIVRSSAGESADVVVARIFEAIDRFAGRAPQFDDITVMVLKKL
jgi:sigma-B regulation protein RsbU (phosphoserine phosphatase)